MLPIYWSFIDQVSNVSRLCFQVNFQPKSSPRPAFSLSRSFEVIVWTFPDFELCVSFKTWCDSLENIVENVELSENVELFPEYVSRLEPCRPNELLEEIFEIETFSGSIILRWLSARCQIFKISRILKILLSNVLLKSSLRPCYCCSILF